MDEIISLKTFSEINLEDKFFNSLKNDYPKFEDWFKRKATEGQKAYVQYSNNQIQAFLHLKPEEGEINDIEPSIQHGKHLKVATFKVDAHNTKLGERFVKKIVDAAIYKNFDDIYVTIFPKHEGLIRLISKYGFCYHGKKEGENVYVKKMKQTTGNQLFDYPMLTTKDKRKFILSIYPQYHTKLFPDSILKNEENQRYELIRDISPTNSIHKIYVCFMSKATQLKQGDLIVIYRTTDYEGPARYRSVATSICEVEEIKRKEDFPNLREFIDYSNYYSIFAEDELTEWYKKDNVIIIKMTYNVAFTKRVTRGYMLDKIGISSDYWGFFQLTDEQFDEIIKKAEINEGIIIN
ncbi:MAG: N-acetyltransferase [Paludibacteraceae bacterium]|nr:N-acetyltransferase [Paludibacteraceae bacterium]